MTDPLLYRDDSRVRHMLDAMERIVEMCRDLNRAQLRMHEDKTEIILFNLMVLGEAANNISREFAEKNPDVDWRGIAGVRHKIGLFRGLRKKFIGISRFPYPGARRFSA